MTSDEFRLPDYLAHILQAIDKIQRFTMGMDEAAFLSNDLVQDAVIRNFEIIGEASRNIIQKHPEFVTENPLVPLSTAYGMRNALSHGYARVDLDIVWIAIQHDLPALRQQISGLLA